MVYLVILTLILIGVFFFDYKIISYQNDRKGRGLYFFILILLIGISGFSYRIGSDVPAYMHEFESYSNKFSDLFNYHYYAQFINRMPGWIFLNTLVKIAGFDFTFVKLVHAIFINSVILLFIKRITQYKYTTCLLYFIVQFPNFNFEILRESTAVVFFILAVPFLLKSNYKKYYIYSLFAILFHISAAILLLLPFFIKKITLQKRRKIIILTFIFIFLAVFSEHISVFLSNIFSYSPSLHYLSQIYFNHERYSSSLLSYEFVVFILLNVYFSYYLIFKYRKEGIRNLNEIDSFIVIYTIIFFLSILIPIFNRVNNYFQLFFLIYLAHLPYLNIKISSNLRWIKKTTFICIFLFFISFNVYNYIRPVTNTPYLSYVRYYPYYSVFTKKKDDVRENFYMYIRGANY